MNLPIVQAEVRAAHARAIRLGTRTPGPKGAGAIPLALLLAGIRLGDAAATLMAGALTGLALPAFGLSADWRQQLLLTLAGTAATWFTTETLNPYTVASLKRLRSRLAIRAMGVLAAAPVVLLCLWLQPGDRALLLCWTAVWVALAILLQSASHVVLSRFLRRWLASGRLARRVGVVGLNELCTQFLDNSASEPDLLDVVGLYRDNHDAPLTEYAGRTVTGPLEDIVSLGQRHMIDAVVLAIPLDQASRIDAARKVLGSMITDVYLVTGLVGVPSQVPELLYRGSTPLVKLHSRPMSAWQSMQKAALDRGLSFMLLMALAPLFAVTALLIKADSTGPVFFRQPRLGFNNVMYTMFKFRTMHHGQADLLATRQTTRGDARITRVGRLLRKLSIDELPQLFNVLGGSMSLVGPRPHAPNTKAGDLLFHDAVADYALRHRVKPGITGWAQVNGWRGETRTVEHIRERVRHDLYYIENWSHALDLRILVLTLVREINSKTAF